MSLCSIFFLLKIKNKKAFFFFFRNKSAFRFEAFINCIFPSGRVSVDPPPTLKILKSYSLYYICICIFFLKHFKPNFKGKKNMCMRCIVRIRTCLIPPPPFFSPHSTSQSVISNVGPLLRTYPPLPNQPMSKANSEKAVCTAFVLYCTEKFACLCVHMQLCICQPT